MIGSIFLLTTSIWQIFQIVVIYGYIDFSYIISLGLEFIASLLLMIGFILCRGEQSRLAIVSPAGPQIPSVPTRFCPKCGKQIPTDAQFCPFCRWQVEGQKRK
jgi:hypothetical protein